MSLPWIAVSKRLLEAVKLINSTPDDHFRTILLRVAADGGEVFTPDELVKLERTLGLGAAQTRVLVQAIVHIFDRASSVVLKPTTLQKNLADVLRLDAGKADEFVRAWTESTKAEFGDLDSRKKVDDVQWQLNVETDHVRERVAPKARVLLSLSDLGGGNAEDAVLEFDEDELVRLYGVLEDVQAKLDAMK